MKVIFPLSVTMLKELCEILFGKRTKELTLFFHLLYQTPCELCPKISK
jgi:hypothetical protein